MTLSIAPAIEAQAPVPLLLAALAAARQVVQPELRQVEALLSERPSPANEDGHRARPLLALLAARAVGDGAGACHVAAAAELVHAASLVMDDWLDRAHLRRGRRALHLRLGPAAAALASTELVAQAFGRLAEGGSSPAVIAELAAVIGDMASSEREEIDHRRRPGLTPDEREALNRLKTARLLEWAVLAGARAAGATAREEAALSRFARALGAAWQHLDDLLDLVSDPSVLGKDVFADIVRGRSTLPVILGARASDRIRDDLAEVWRDDLPPMGRGALRVRFLDELERCGAFDATADRIDALATEAEAALGRLSPSAATEALAAVPRAVRDAAWAAATPAPADREPKP